MGLNYNDQEPGGINKYTDVSYNQETKESFTNTNVTDADTDAYIGLNNYAIFKKINVITGTQDDPSALTSKTGVTQDDPSTLSSITDDPKKSSNMTPDKGHRKNLVASPPLRKCPIH